jgi:hypothetical protein
MNGMEAVRSLTFVANGWTLTVSALAVLVTVAISYFSWRRAGYRAGHAALEALRLAIVTLAAVLLNQPEWVEEFRPTQKPTIAVIWDDSASMETRDVVQPSTGGTSTNAITRQEAIASLINPETWAKLSAKLNVVIQPLSAGWDSDSAPLKRATNLAEPLATASERFKNLRGILLISDGDWNTGDPPVLAASSLRLKGVPVFAAPVGSPSRLPDIDLVSLDVATFGIAGKSLRIPFAIDSALPREYVVNITLRVSDGTEVTKEVRIAPMGRTSDALIWKPPATGDYTVTLSIPAHPDEALLNNNSRAAPVAIRDEKLKVLIVESLPRWEYRYLRNALSRDPGVELSCLLFQTGLSKAGGGTKDYIKQFPNGIEELAKFDVVFLGDVGLDAGQLTTEDCRLLKGIVEHHATGLVIMPGWQGHITSLMETELADLCPVVFDPAQPRGWGSRQPSHFELTESGRRSLLTKLADTQEENNDVWESLPGFQWYAPVLRAKGGTEVLCVHKDASNESGRLPLLVTRTFGSGKVLFMGTDGAWRWRKGVEDKYHYRFWGQVVRWMAYQRNMAKGETMRLYYSPEQPQVGQTISMRANVMEKTGEPLKEGEVTARIESPSGKVDTVRFRSTGDEWGAFATTATVTEPGRHAVTLISPQTNGRLETSIFVQGSATEKIGSPARPEVLNEIANLTRGKVVDAANPEQIIDSLTQIPEPPPSIRRLQLWCHPLTALGFVLLLGIFWTGRKMIGMI